MPNIMISDFIITFRETLEAALIVGIILAYLVKTKRIRYAPVVYIGIGTAVVASIISAFLFSALAGGFEGRAEEIFEGISMLVAAVLITFMILWMLRQKHIVVDLHKKVDSQISQQQRLGLFFLVFISVFREGIETVIFLGAAAFAAGDQSLVGALVGMIAAIALGYVIFVAGKRLNIKKFFNITSVLLILFAAGLVAHGVHEFEEAKLLPETIEHVWDINPPQNPDGSYPALHEKGAIGSILTGLFGYNGMPCLLEVIAYIGYLVLIIILWKNIDRIHQVI